MEKQKKKEIENTLILISLSSVATKFINFLLIYKIFCQATYNIGFC